jgi:OmpA-OmpF porin, OOP family
MGLFDGVLSDVKQRLGLGDEADRLLNSLLSLITSDGQGGLAGFLNRFRNAGLGDAVNSWLSRGSNLPLSAPQVEQALGGGTVERIANDAGMTRGSAAAGLGMMIPAVVDRLTPDGVVPSAQSILSSLSGYFGGAADRAADRVSEVASTAVTAGERVTASVGRVGDVKYDRAVAPGPGIGRWLPLLFLALLALVAFWWLSNRTAEPDEPDLAGATRAPATPTTQPAPPATAATTGATVNPTLSIRNRDGNAVVSGTVPDSSTRDSILGQLRSAFGESRVSGDIAVDPQLRNPTWAGSLGSAVAALKTPGAEASFEGDTISVGGSVPPAQRDSMIEKLRSAFSADVTVGTFDERADSLSRSATAKATAAIAALPEGFTAGALASALNLSMINFASGSAEIPAESRLLLDEAAKALQRAPAGTVIEIASHTDNTGNAAANQKLSQARAEAVRVALVQRGVPEASLVATGYGGDKPVADNDSEAGRFKNRRIEYAVVKS